MRAAQVRGRGAPPGLIETLFNHSRTSSDRKCLFSSCLVFLCFLGGFFLFFLFFFGFSRVSANCFLVFF